MRIDKYLWAIRWFKTRNQAAEACKKGQVRVEDKIVKPSKEVFGGERVAVRKNQVNKTLEVIDLPASRVGAKLVSLYAKDTTPIEELSRNQEIRSTQSYYRAKGEGRPTKKDRRDIDEYLDDHEE